jgi:hypothetical protein
LTPSFSYRQSSNLQRFDKHFATYHPQIPQGFTKKAIYKLLTSSLMKILVETQNFTLEPQRMAIPLLTNWELTRVSKVQIEQAALPRTEQNVSSRPQPTELLPLSAIGQRLREILESHSLEPLRLRCQMRRFQLHLEPLV